MATTDGGPPGPSAEATMSEPIAEILCLAALKRGPLVRDVHHWRADRVLFNRGTVRRLIARGLARREATACICGGWMLAAAIVLVLISVENAAAGPGLHRMPDAQERRRLLGLPDRGRAQMLVSRRARTIQAAAALAEPARQVSPARNRLPGLSKRAASSPCWSRGSSGATRNGSRRPPVVAPCAEQRVRFP